MDSFPENYYDPFFAWHHGGKGGGHEKDGLKKPNMGMTQVLFDH